ncbi:MAG TPA: aldo/keto reductase [Methylomirabilota bacterium]|nr:aldo/keto reductase [Methylomirabilota bacterium]
MITRPFGSTGAQVAVIGQGTWGMGESRASRKAEVAALRLGIELGMTHIDTAELYASGGAEAVVAEAVAGQREHLFIATKVLPSNASYAGTLSACERSLRRLRTDYVDLYLVHWWSSQHPIAETMKAMEELVARGMVRFIGVSNFDVAQTKAAQAALARGRLACNQLLYHLRDRSIEKREVPHCERHKLAVVGYTPLKRGGFLRGVVAEIAERHGRTPRQVALNFLTRRPSLFTIPKATQPEHVRENAEALDFTLSAKELRAIDRAF